MAGHRHDPLGAGAIADVDLGAALPEKNNKVELIVFVDSVARSIMLWVETLENGFTRTSA